MFRPVPALLLAAACGLAPTGAARAQPRSDPADAAAPVPPLIYASPFAGGRSVTDDQPTPWPAANADVGRIGGWRAYAREARAATPAVPASAPAGSHDHGVPRGRP